MKTNKLERKDKIVLFLLFMAIYSYNLVIIVNYLSN